MISWEPKTELDVQPVAAGAVAKRRRGAAFVKELSGLAACRVGGQMYQGITLPL
jgi:hypothetical protein